MPNSIDPFSAPDHADLAATHTPENVRQRLQTPTTHSYLRDFVYGAIDGTVTTFAIVSGVAGAGLSTGVILILGVANLVGDGFSMAASNYLGTKTEEELRRNNTSRITQKGNARRFVKYLPTKDLRATNWNMW